MDVITGINVAKQALELLKVIRDGRDEGLVREAAGQLSEKITELQMLNVELSGMYQAERQITMELREENKKIEMFALQAASYDLHTTDGGSTVYRSKKPAEPDVQFHYLCAHCYSGSKVSILQPKPERSQHGGFFIHYCPLCKNEFRMNKIPAWDLPKSVRPFAH